MPTPPRTSLDQIVRRGRRIVEEQGLEGLTMQGVAEAVGVRAPSLYKHIRGRGELIRLVVESVLRELGEVLDQSITGDDPRADLGALAAAFRSFALGHPKSYRVLFAPLPEDWMPDQEVFVAASDAVRRTTEAMSGPERALDAARLVTAWALGFMTMELAGAFHMEGDLDQAFQFGVERIAESLSQHP